MIPEMWALNIVWFTGNRVWHLSQHRFEEPHNKHFIAKETPFRFWIHIHAYKTTNIVLDQFILTGSKIHTENMLHKYFMFIKIILFISNFLTFLQMSDTHKSPKKHYISPVVWEAVQQGTRNLEGFWSALMATPWHKGWRSQQGAMVCCTSIMEEFGAYVKTGGSLGCSNPELMEFGILRGGDKAKSRTINLDSGEPTLAYLGPRSAMVAGPGENKGCGQQLMFKDHLLQLNRGPSSPSGSQLKILRDPLDE